MARRQVRYTERAQPKLDGKGAVVEPAKPGRDEGKVFELTEMSSAKGEDWALRALLAMTNAGADVPDDIRGAGMAGVALMTLQALSGLRYVDAKPLFDEVMTCVRYVPDPSRPDVVRDLIDDDIEEVTTRISLRKAVLELHLNFSMPDNLSTPGQSGQASPGAIVITRTSPGPSA